MDFIALDVETANADMASICALGLVHFKNGEIFKNLSTLIDPEDEFDPINISIHGIRPTDVVGKPTMKVVYPALQAHLASCIVVHHTHFDKTAFNKAGARLGAAPLDVNWLDSSRVARRAWPQCARKGFGLECLASEFNIAFKHHQAEEDARRAGLIMLRAVADTQIQIEDWFVRVEQPIKPGEKLARPGNPEGPLFGEVIAFTGQLSIDRNEAARIAADAGCEVRSGVTRQTTILVIGDQDARVLNGAEFSAKRRKALDLIQAGASIRVIPEADFRALVFP